MRGGKHVNHAKVQIKGIPDKKKSLTTPLPAGNPAKKVGAIWENVLQSGGKKSVS